MLPDYSSFLSYRPSTDPKDYALLGDESRSNIDGRGNAVFSMSGHLVLIRNSLCVPSLRAPLYSTQRHRAQPGYAYYYNDTVGNLIISLLWSSTWTLTRTTFSDSNPLVAPLGTANSTTQNPVRPAPNSQIIPCPWRASTSSFQINLPPNT